MKNIKVQVSEQFYNSVVELLDSANRTLFTAREWELAQFLQTEIDAKEDAKKRRELFTAYKTEKPGAERDGKRIDYLIEAGKSRSFRSPKEIPETN